MRTQPQMEPVLHHSPSVSSSILDTPGDERSAYRRHQNQGKCTLATFNDRLYRITTVKPGNYWLNAQLNLLSFNSEYVTLPIWYHPGVIHPVGSDSRSDIEKFLDGVALQSDIIHMPERHPEQRPYFRQTQSPKIIDIVSRYRERFGLPPACTMLLGKRCLGRVLRVETLTHPWSPPMD